jgi:hypothetical protein
MSGTTLCCPFVATCVHWHCMQVDVPGNWETQGFGRPVYTNFKYPFPVNPPYVPADNPTGCYTTTFTIESSSLSASHMSLVFDGVDSAFAVWLNGTFLGYSQDSRLPAEFSICSFCTAGSNLLAVQVRATLCCSLTAHRRAADVTRRGKNDHSTAFAHNMSCWLPPVIFLSIYCIGHCYCLCSGCHGA